MAIGFNTKKIREIPLRVFIIVPFLIQVVVMVGLVGYLSFQTGRQAVNNVANQLRSEIAARVAEHLHVFLNTLHQINAINSNAIRRGSPNASAPDELERHFWQQIQVFTSVSSVFFGNTKGGLADAGREGADGSLYVIATDEFASGPFRKFATNKDGDRTDLITTIPDFDARTRAWYVDAVSRQREIWSNIYVLFTGQDMAISASRPVYDEQENLLGVVSSEVFLSHIARYLNQLDIGETGQCFIMERSGLLVASSTEERPFTNAEENGAQRRLFATESGIEDIRNAAAYFQERFGSYENISDEQQHFDTDINGERHFLQISAIRDSHGIDWLVVVIIPESDFLKQIYANVRTTVLLVGIALAIAIVVGIATARGVARPIMQLNTFTHALAKGEWNRSKKVVRIAEIRELSQSFSTMAARLQQTLEGLQSEVKERRQVDETLRRNEAGLRALLQNMPVMMDAMDKNGHIIVWNQECERVTGFTAVEIIGDTDVAQLLYPDANAETRMIERRALLGGDFRNIEWEIGCKDGSKKSILWSSMSEVLPVPGWHSWSIGVDITDRKRVEQETLRARKLESVGLLAGGIAHDFNNLLTSVFGNIELATMYIPDDHASRPFLASAGKSIDNATNLTKQLLTFAKGGDPVKETLSVGDVIAETAAFSIRGSGVKLICDIAPNLWSVDADRGQLSQVISNLVINAKQAMPTGGLITVIAENDDASEPKRIKITIMDEGGGIAAEHLDKVFDPYFSTKQQGSGLGLASAHSIISKHDGTISVDSRFGTGTAFVVSLPAVEVTRPNPTIAPVDVQDPFPIPSSARILVLDDDKAVRKVAEQMLGKMGCEVVLAADGSEAIEKYRKSIQRGTTFDIVIADLTLPGGMNGCEAANKILDIDPQARIIISSGYATDPIMANYAAHGFIGIAAKPYRYEDIRAVISRAFEMKR